MNLTRFECMVGFCRLKCWKTLMATKLSWDLQRHSIFCCQVFQSKSFIVSVSLDQMILSENESKNTKKLHYLDTAPIWFLCWCLYTQRLEHLVGRYVLYIRLQCSYLYYLHKTGMIFFLLKSDFWFCLLKKKIRCNFCSKEEYICYG